MLPILLLTRPLPQSRRFAAEAAQACPPHEAVIAPLSEVAGLAYDPGVFAGAAGVVLTSANAVRFLPPLPGMTAWCVGAATAAAAARAGLVPVDGGGDAAALIARLAAARPEGRLVHAHGRHLARDLVAALPQLDLRGVAVYEARALDLPPGLLAGLQGRRVAVALFSPRAAAGFARQQGADGTGLVPVAISAACAGALTEPLRARSVISATPDSGGMLQAVAAAMSQDRPAG